MGMLGSVVFGTLFFCTYHKDAWVAAVLAAGVCAVALAVIAVESGEISFRLGRRALARAVLLSENPGLFWKILWAHVAVGACCLLAALWYFAKRHMSVSGREHR